jgi:amino acid adenylation domain-containing protein
MVIAAAEPLSGAWPPGCQAFPASFAQARLWLLHQLEPQLTAYHLPALWRLRGDLDVSALARALSLLVERHPSLRTSFRLQGSEVVQIIHPPLVITLPVEALGDRDALQVMDHWLHQESHTPFDLTAGLLLRARLLRVAHQEHLLLLNHHHIASDGWSRAVLTRDLIALYNAKRSCFSQQLNPLTASYHDYASWQRRRLSGPILQELLGFWIPHLEGVKSLDLPIDYRRPSSPSFRGGKLFFHVQPSLLEPFEVLCRSEGATLQMGLVALHALLLHRYSDQKDFAIGIPFWGRNDPTSWRRAASQLVDLIGFFINTLPIRTSFLPSHTFRELLQQVKRTSLEAYEHHELPFEQIIDALKLERDRGRNPLIQVMLQLDQLPRAALQGLDDLKVETLPTFSNTAKLDLEFFLRRTNGGLKGSIIYAKDLFAADRIERLSTHLTTLLTSVVQAPDAPADSLNLLPDPERRLIDSWLRGPEIQVADLCVHELFEQQVERTPEAIALVFQEHQLTYTELDARANRLAHHLIAHGIGPETIVAVGLERSLEMVVALLGILKAGGAYLPLDPSWPLERRELLLREAGCMCLLIRGPMASGDSGWPGAILALNEIGGVECQGTAGGPAGSAEQEAGDQRPATSPWGRLAYLTYTSGSTGVPKGVAIEHRSILRLVDPVNGFRLGAGAGVLQLAPLAFDAATFEIWGPLLNGGRLVLAPPGRPSLGELGDLLRREGISTLWLTAGLFHAMVEEELEALAGVGQVLAGGDVLSPEHVQRLLDAFPPSHELINGYGPTENTTFTCCHRMTVGEVVDSQRVPIGRPIAGTTVHVLDPHGNPCPIGIPGELHFGGAGLARGYFYNPELTAEKFIPDPFSSDPSARLYKSGDLASWNPDGTLAFHGRLDQQIKLRGFRIEPGEIEAHLMAHPAVARAVLLRSDDPSNPRLIGYWVGVAGATVSAEELRGFLTERLPDYMVPAALVELETLPLTANGKLDRKALPEPSFAGDRERRVEPGTELERRLHGIWAEVLGHSDFGIEANFFELGGHSLSAASLSARIEQKLGRSLPLSVLFQAPTIAQLAGWLENEGLPAGKGFRSLVTLQSRGEEPPLFVVHGGEGTVYIHLHLARCLAPDRPVYGLQAVGFDVSEPRHSSVEEMAAHYADEILRFRPHGPYHLLGYSGGGWYAWAVAAELRRRGASLGLVGMVDTGGTADLHRRLRMQQLLLRKMHRLPVRARQWILRGSGDRSTVLSEKWNALRFIGWTLLRPRGQMAPQASDPDAMPRPTQPLRGDYFIQLHTYYRPPRLPVRTDIFAAASAQKNHRRLWNFYSRGRAHIHPCLDQHTDFFHAEPMPDIAEALTAVLRQIEARSAP